MPPCASVSLFVKPKSRGLDDGSTVPEDTRSWLQRTQAHTLWSRPSPSRKRTPDAENHDVCLGRTLHRDIPHPRGPALCPAQDTKPLCLMPRGEGTGVTVDTQLCGLGCQAEPFREPHGPAWSRHPNTQPPSRGRVNAPFKLTHRISELGALGLGWEVHAGTQLRAAGPSEPQYPSSD